MISLKLETEDRYIYKKNSLWLSLIDAKFTDQDLEILFYPEGPCARSLGLYEILDQFCENTGYNKSRITIVTGNMIEYHPNYNIVKNSNYWYEVHEIQKWLKINSSAIIIDNYPTKHFGNFIGRARWPRLWLAAWLRKNHSHKVFQTFHSSLSCNYKTSATDLVKDWLGIEDLIYFECDMIPDVIDFLNNAPYVVEEELNEFSKIKNIFYEFFKTDTYPILHPASMNILKFYNDIFVDVVIETNVDGDNFFVTEKLWRCILAKRPFIVMAPRNYLFNLRKLGFKTFHDYWSENYDAQSNQTKIKMIQEVVNNIAQWPISRCQQELNNMKSILDHNYTTYTNLTDKKINEIFSAKTF